MNLIHYYIPPDVIHKNTLALSTLHCLKAYSNYHSYNTKLSLLSIVNHFKANLKICKGKWMRIREWNGGIDKKNYKPIVKEGN